MPKDSQSARQEIKHLLERLKLPHCKDQRTITVRMPSSLHAALLEKSRTGASINQFCVLSILAFLEKEQ